ncbi:TetR/AcrR family transcriptional regulator [Kitasatospora camelliae]|uniref:TetR/AcrR family transcriptional regulator n=1 Tax=Kitasatospora camelliae TaxID=3156397 RepID=UPI003B5871AA
MAEHRQLQRAALLDAARTLLTEGGRDALTFPALAARTGMARSSVYEYFRSRAAVVEELCAADFPLWAAEIEAGMAACATAAGRIEAYVRGQLALAADPRHRAVVAISELELDAAARERIRAAHSGLIALLVQALEELGHEQPRLAASLLQGVVEAAVRQSERAPSACGAGTAGAVGTCAAVPDGSGAEPGGTHPDSEAVADAAVALALYGLTRGVTAAEHGTPPPPPPPRP